jgi:hypothetical protein
MQVLLTKDNFLKALVVSFLTGLMLFAMLLFRKEDLGKGIVVLQLPFVILFVGAVLKEPRLGLLAAFIINYFALGLNRYIAAPWGLSIDALLLLCWASIFFKAFNEKIPFQKAKNSLTLVASIWYGYIFLQLLNPEAASREAWFYAMRGLAFYQFLIIPLAFILLDHPKYLFTMIRLWAVFAMLAVLKGIMQKHYGFDPFEQRWLDQGGALTHIIMSGTRYFSFFSDAGNYGAHMAMVGVVFSIIGLHSPKTGNKIIFFIVALAAFYGMLISGTRGALAVPAAGFLLYTVISKRMKIFIPSIILLIGIYSFLKFTTIAQNVNEVRRMRSALDPNDPSLQVRLANQKILKGYLASRPVGGGIGSSGNWGQRFAPNTFLANVPTDSWYVMIWAETGIVGLYLHICILLFMVGKSMWIIMAKLKNTDLIYPLAGLLAGAFGIMVASYGNGLLGQMPNGIIIYLSMAIIWMAPGWEKEGLDKELDTQQ